MNSSSPRMRQYKRKRSSRHKENRDGDRFLALPLVLLESQAYRSLSFAARALLVDIASQYKGHNNGKLVACKSYLQPLGWTSADTVTRCRKVLESLGLLIETRKGACPNVAAWYALPWHSLDEDPQMDINTEQFNREKLRYRQPPAPTIGAARKPIAPIAGTQHGASAPMNGAMVA